MALSRNLIFANQGDLFGSISEKVELKCHLYICWQVCHQLIELICILRNVFFFGKKLNE